MRAESDVGASVTSDTVAVDPSSPLTTTTAVTRDGGRDESPAWPRVATAVALTLASLAPVITVVLQRTGRAYLPVQDQAVIDLRIRDVLTFSGNTPLVGAYDRFGWNHPGPIMYYLVAPFTWIFGNPAWATLVGFALLQGVAVVWIARLSWKVGGIRWMVVWLSILALSYAATGPFILQMAWNPQVAFPFFVLFLLQCWVVARGDGRRLLGLAFVATFLVQTHVGYAVLVAVLALWAVGRLLYLRRRQALGFTPSLWAPAAAVLAVLWFPPLVLDPILHPPGNLVRLVRFALHPGHAGPLLGLSRGLGYLATEFRWIPPWLGGSDRLNPFTSLASPSPIAWLLVPLVLLAGAWWVARRRGRPELRLLVELLALLLVAGACSLALVRGTPYPYLFYWRIISGSTTVVLALVTVVDGLDRTRTQVLSNGLVILLAIGLLVGSGTLAGRVAAADGPVSPYARVTASLLSQMHAEGQPDGPAIVRFWGSTLGGVQAGIFDQLSREHAPVYTDPDLGFQFGYDRTASTGRVRWVLYVTEESQIYSTMSTLPGARVLAVSHPLPAADQDELIATQRRLAGVLIAQHHTAAVADLGNPFVAFQLHGVAGIAPATLQRLGKLNAQIQAHQCLCGVIGFPAGRVPSSLRPPPTP